MAHDQLFHDQRHDAATVIVFLSPDEKNPSRAWKKRPISNKAESLTRVTARAFASAGHVGVKEQDRGALTAPLRGKRLLC